jgi:hypothetical protein
MRFWSEPRPLKCERAIYKVKVKNWLSKVQSVDQRIRNAVSAFANCGRAVAHIRGSYVPNSGSHGFLFRRVHTCRITAELSRSFRDPH